MKLDMPDKWHRNRAFWLGRSPAIVGIAFNPWHWSVGVELLAGYGKGLAIIAGPFWIGAAIAKGCAQTQSGGSRL